MMKTFATLLFVSSSLYCGVARAAGESREDRMEALLSRIENLEAEVKHLRSEKGGNPASGESEPESPSERVVPMGSGNAMAPIAGDAAAGMDAESESGALPKLNLRGFGDVDYHWADGGDDRDAFRLGQLDLFITSQLSESLSVLNENVIEADEGGQFGFEIERLLLQYNPRDYFNIAVGRYHTSIGYYNTAYHHGKWLQTAVDRPRIMDFEDEGGLLPVHNVGVSMTGAIPSGRLGLNYVAEIGNGRSYEPGAESVQNLSDNNDFKAVNFALNARPDWLPGFQTGVSVYYDQIASSLVPKVDQTIVGVHAVYVTPGFEWLHEGLLVRDSSAMGTFDTFSAYSQIARSFGRLRPYLRYQFIDAADGDPLMALTGTPGLQHILSAGIRYEVAEFAALKLQWDRALRGGDDALRNELTVQFSFTF